MPTSPKFISGKRPGKPGRAPDPTMKAGMIFGHLRIVQRTRTKVGVKYICECLGPDLAGKICHKRCSVPGSYLKRPKNPKTCCGCQVFKHANPYPREKNIWGMMHFRCYDARHVSYKDYGGRGIQICARWHKDNPDGFKNFMEDMGPAPSKKYSIDRIHPNYGYAPFLPDGTPQCRWADAKTQANNKRSHWINKDYVPQTGKPK